MPREQAGKQLTAEIKCLKIGRQSYRRVREVYKEKSSTENSFDQIEEPKYYKEDLNLVKFISRKMQPSL